MKWHKELAMELLSVVLQATPAGALRWLRINWIVPVGKYITFLLIYKKVCALHNSDDVYRPDVKGDLPMHFRVHRKSPMFILSSLTLRNPDTSDLGMDKSFAYVLLEWQMLCKHSIPHRDYAFTLILAGLLHVCTYCNNPWNGYICSQLLIL